MLHSAYVTTKRYKKLGEGAGGI